MKFPAAAIAALLLASAPGFALSQAPADAHGNHSAHTPLSAAPASQAAGTPADTHDAHANHADSSDLSEGEITRWDARTLKVTLRHGEIKNLGMPPMSMVFRVQDTSVVGALKPGDKVRFRAEQVDGVYTVTQLEAAP